jgi:hypothetical protein
MTGFAWESAESVCPSGTSCLIEAYNPEAMNGREDNATDPYNVPPASRLRIAAMSRSFQLRCEAICEVVLRKLLSKAKQTAGPDLSV